MSITALLLSSVCLFAAPVQDAKDDDEAYRFTSAPLRFSSNLGFNQLIHVPSLESPYAFAESGFALNAGLDITLTDISESGSDTANIDTQIGEEFVELRAAFGMFGLGADVGIRVVGSRLEELDGSTTLTEGGNQVFVADEDREWDLSQLVVSGKLELPSLGAPIKLGVLIEGKFSLADEDNLTDAGTTDLAVALLAEIKVDQVSINANVGIVVPFGDAEVFTLTVEDVELAEIWAGGISLNYHPGVGYSFVLQVQGFTSPFEEVEVLEHATYYASAGMKMKLFPGFFIQLGAGSDLSEFADDWVVAASVTLYFE